MCRYAISFDNDGAIPCNQCHFVKFDGVTGINFAVSSGKFYVYSAFVPDNILQISGQLDYQVYRGYVP